MKLSMARVSVSAWTRQTCSRSRLAGDDLAFAVGEVAEEVGLHDGEVGDAVGGDEFEGVKVDGAVVEEVECRMGAGLGGSGSRGCGCLPGGAAQQGLDADEEDVEVEGLGEVVVGAGFEAFEDVFGAGAGGEHQDGGVSAGRRAGRG